MAQKTDVELAAEKEIIKNETLAKANTATRVGTMFEDLISSKINNDVAIKFGGVIGSAPSLPLTINTFYISSSDWDFDGTAIFDGSWLFGPSGAASVDDFYIKP